MIVRHDASASLSCLSQIQEHAGESYTPPSRHRGSDQIEQSQVFDGSIDSGLCSHA